MSIRYVRRGLQVVRVVDATAPLLETRAPTAYPLSLADAADYLRTIAAGLRAERKRTLALRYKHQADRAREAARLGRPLPNRGPGRDVTGKELRQAREAVGYSQRELAQDFPYGRSLIAECERGVRSVPPDLGAWATQVLRTTRKEDRDDDDATGEAGGGVPGRPPLRGGGVLDPD